MRRELARYRGQELDAVGDGVFASFDGPGRAIGCACAIRDTARALGLELRSGLHTGECKIASGKPAGIAVHTGARVAALAGPAEVLVSQTVKDLVAGSGLELRTLMAEGLTDRGIAARLYLTHNTVETHIRHIIAKLGLPATPADNRRVHAVLAYLRSG